MRVYSFANTIVSLSYDGTTHTVAGWADGDDVISIARAGDSMSHAMGAGGDMVISVGADISGTVTLKLQMTSSSNQFLQKVLDEQESCKLNSFKLLTISFKDPYRGDSSATTSGYITKYADIVRGTNAGTTEWTIAVEKLQLLYGDIGDAQNSPTSA
jgi:hypothetical protein